MLEWIGWLSSKLKTTGENYYIQHVRLIGERLDIKIIQTFSEDPNDTSAFKRCTFDAKNKILISPLPSQLYRFPAESKSEVSNTPFEVLTSWHYQDNNPDPWHYKGPSVWSIYNKEDSDFLEFSYLEGKTEASLENYIVDFQKGLQTSKASYKKKEE